MKIDKHTIHKILDNEGTADEINQFKKSISTDEGMSELSAFIDDDISAITEDRANLWVCHETVPEERMKERFKQGMSMHIRKKRTFNWWVAAAIIPILLLSYSVIYLGNRAGIFNETEYAEITTKRGEQLQVILQDGTIVYLNAESSLNYPKQFGLFSRNVKLSGEGYFIVAKDKSRPFSVDLNSLEVEVTGTQFNVKSYPEDSCIWVALDEGAVNLLSRKMKYAMVPGETAQYNKLSGECSVNKSVEIQNFSSWKNKELAFNLTPLSEIIKTIERQYNISIIVQSPDLLTNRFTLHLKDAEIDDVIQDIQKVSSLRIIKLSPNTYQIQ